MSGPIAFAVEATVGTETATLTTTHNFAPRKPLRIAYLPIQYQGFTPPDALNSDYWLRRLYPVPAVEYYRLPVPDLVWEGELNKGELLQELLYTYWLYTQHNPVESWPDQLFGWLSPEVYNGGASDPAWCTDCAGSHSGRVAFGSLRSERDIGGPRILAHEIAHNLGAKHAWSPTQQQDGQCFRAEGADIQVDPTWPYAETPYIQEIGLDLYSDPPLVYPAATYDMMAYCAQPWISPYTYRTLFESQLLQPISGDSNASADFRPNQPPKNTLLISGLIYPNGTASQPQVVQLETAQPANPIPQSGPTTEDYSGDYCLTLSAYDNATLAKYCFAATFVDTETGLLTEASPYFFTLPNLEVSQIARITLNSGTTSLATLTPSSTPPDVTLTFPNAGETLSDQQTITWQARDTDGDQLTYDLLYSPDAGQTWLPLAVHLTERHYTFETAALLFSQQALIRVIANDGFHTQIDETDKTFTIDNLPH
jgi:hypothetical protein